MNPVEKLTDMSYDLGVSVISRQVFKIPRFATCSGASTPGVHHYGVGGLAQHTLEVVELCLMNNDYFKGTLNHIDKRIVFLAALFHDIGKIYDCKEIDTKSETDKEELATWHKKHIYHITKSVIIWDRSVINVKSRLAKEYSWLTSAVRDEVTHAILAHHGRPEWGSPVQPNTKLAWLLHLCDSISARVTDSNKEQ